MKARRIAWSIVGAVLLCATTRALNPIAILGPSDVPEGYTNVFGWSVAISGDYIVVGAPLDPIYNGNATGAVYVFRRKGPNWIEQGKLMVSQPSFQDELGWSVAIDGDVIVAGAPAIEPGNCDSRRGAVYVFRRDDRGTPDDPADDTWNQEAQLLPPDPAPYPEHLGVSTAIQGDVIVAGQGCWGGVQVFRREGGSWRHEASLTGSDMEGRYGFGFSVAVDGDRIVAGAYGNPMGPGAAYVFVRDGTAWVEEQVLAPTDHTTPDSFGEFVSISGNYVLVGASGVRSAYAYVRDDNGAWAEQARLTAPDTDVGQFGARVGIDDDLIVIGRYLFHRDNGVWRNTDKFFGFESVWGRGNQVNGKYGVVATSVYVVRERKSLRDYASFQTCFTGGIAPGPSAACNPFDLSGDGRVDLTDFEVFVGTFVGPQR